MTYSHSVGTLYATAGFGAGPSGISPPFRRYGFRSFDGLGAADTPTEMSVRVIQRGLVASGVSPGPGSVDGKWGPNTRASLREFMASNRMTGVDNARAIAALPPGTPTGARSVTIPNAYASRLEQLSGQYQAPSGGGGGGSPAPSASDMEVVPDAMANVQDWLPWVIGGGVLVGLGGYFVYRGRQRKRVAANRRRRRRRSSRRRR